MKYRTTFKDWILKAWLGTKSLIRYTTNTCKAGTFEIPSNYKLVFSDNFMNDYKINWIEASHWWAQPYHPDFLDAWFDPAQITQGNEGIEFNISAKPRYFPEVDTTMRAAGTSIKSKEAWQYGIFKFIAKLPSGPQLWPALWLTGNFSWPPEIDLLEGYSNNSDDYDNGIRLLSNVHMTYKGGKNDVGSARHRLSNKVTEEFIEYVIWWEEDFIKLYYNGYLVRHITDKKALETMNETMVIVVGAGNQKEFNQTAKTPMIVNRVAVYQK